MNSISKLYDKNSLEQRSFPSYKTKLKSKYSETPGFCDVEIGQGTILLVSFQDIIIMSHDS